MSDTQMLPVDPSTIDGLQSVLDNAPYVRKGNLNLKVYNGTKVFNRSGNSQDLFLTNAEIKSIIGHAFDQNTDWCNVVNAEYSACPRSIECWYLSDSGIIVRYRGQSGSSDSDGTGATRLNYCIIARP